MHLSITPAPRGNIASPSHGGDTTFQRGESPAGVASSPETCLAQGRLMVAASWAAGGKESCFVESFFFFFQSSTQTFGLFSKAAESRCGFSCLALNQMLSVWGWWEAEARRNSNTEQMGCVSISLVYTEILLLSLCASVQECHG